MTTTCIILNSIIAEHGGTDKFLSLLYSAGASMMASARCFFTSWKVVVRRYKPENEPYLEILEPNPNAKLPFCSCPTSLIGAIVNWDTKTTIWRRDGATHQVPVPKRKPKKSSIQAGTYPSPASDQEALF